MDSNDNGQEFSADFKADMAVLTQFLSSIPHGLAFHRMIFNQDGKPIDYVFLEVNEMFEKWTGLHRTDILNRRVTEVLPGIENDPSDWIGKYGNVAMTGVATAFESYAEPLDKWYRVIAFCPEKGFFITIFDDVSERKKIEKEREELIAELRKAITEIKQLRGILPICASCKKIRNDRGAWTQIESYISDHSEAEFSHGVCPDCAKKLFPDLDLYNDKENT